MFVIQSSSRQHILSHDIGLHHEEKLQHGSRHVGVLLLWYRNVNILAHKLTTNLKCAKDILRAGTHPESVFIHLFQIRSLYWAASDWLGECFFQNLFSLFDLMQMLRNINVKNCVIHVSKCISNSVDCCNRCLR